MSPSPFSPPHRHSHTLTPPLCLVSLPPLCVCSFCCVLPELMAPFLICVFLSLSFVFFLLFWTSSSSSYRTVHQTQASAKQKKRRNKYNQHLIKNKPSLLLMCMRVCACVFVSMTLLCACSALHFVVASCCCCSFPDSLARFLSPVFGHRVCGNSRSDAINNSLPHSRLCPSSHYNSVDYYHHHHHHHAPPSPLSPTQHTSARALGGGRRVEVVVKATG